MQKSGVKFYSNRLIRVRGGEIVGTLCILGMTPRTLTDQERQTLDSLGEITGQLVQGIIDSADQHSFEKAQKFQDSAGAISLSRLDFTSLFELSPVPTAVLSYPDCRYVAANDPMISGCGIPLENILGNHAGDAIPWRDEAQENGEWLPEFRRRLDMDGLVQDLELTVRLSDNSVRHLLMDGRFIQFDGESHVLVTGRDVTEERERDRSLRLLLEGTNIQLGDDWFRSAAAAFSELMDAELVIIAECVRGYQKRLTTHVVLDAGTYCENLTFDVPETVSCPIFDGKPMFLEEGDDQAFSEDCPFWKPGLRFIQGVPIMDSADKVIGLISVASGTSKAASKDHEMIFKNFCFTGCGRNRKA